MVKKIDGSKIYSLSEIVREGLIPGIDNIVKASRLVKADKKTNKVLNASRVPRGENGVQYKVKGENIIKYLVYLDEQKEN